MIGGVLRGRRGLVFIVFCSFVSLRPDFMRYLGDERF